MRNVVSGAQDKFSHRRKRGTRRYKLLREHRTDGLKIEQLIGLLVLFGYLRNSASLMLGLLRWSFGPDPIGNKMRLLEDHKMTRIRNQCDRCGRYAGAN